MNWTNLTEKNVAITGGACGIGLAVAKGFAEVGANVILADFAEEQGAEAIEEISSLGSGEAVFVRCDVTSKADVENMVATAVERFGRLDVLVNNAGINVPRLLVDPTGKEELTEEIWDKVFAVNVKGQFLCAQAAARAMLADGQGGVLINMSSESGMEGSEGQSVYAATKAGIVQMVRALAAELGPSGVRVNAVAPGVVDTPLTAQIKAHPAWYAAYAARTIFNRWASSEEMIGPTVFLASDAASYVTGTVLFADGGWTAIDGRFEPDL